MQCVVFAYAPAPVLELPHRLYFLLADRASILVQRLAEMGVNFIAETTGDKDFSGIQKGEVVILPAFGAIPQRGQRKAVLSHHGRSVVAHHQHVHSQRAQAARSATTPSRLPPTNA